MQNATTCDKGSGAIFLWRGRHCVGAPAPIESCHGDFFLRQADHTWRFADVSTMNRRWIEMRHSLVVFALFVVGTLASPCGAQAPPPVPIRPPVQTQAGQTPQAVPSAEFSGRDDVEPASRESLGGGLTTSSSTGKRFGTAGRGLPGMQGGPPIKGSMGYQDSSSRYMRPPAIPPLFCDPAVNIPC
jgi:hypothetical protein